MDDQNKNLILATVLSAAVLLIWFLVFPPEAQVSGDTPTSDGVTTSAPELAPTAPGGTTVVPESVAADPAETRAAAIADTARVAIETPQLIGSVSLTGGRIDDLSLRAYHETLADDSPIVTLLSPANAPNAYYALHGWVPAGDLANDAVPTPQTVWTAPDGATLTPETPLELTWDNGAGLIFGKTIAVDDDFMFTVTQTVANATDGPVRLFPYAQIARHGEPQVENFFISHEGAVAHADGIVERVKYDDMLDLDVGSEGVPMERFELTEEGWIGFADKYWMTTLIPDVAGTASTVIKYVPGADIYQTETRLPVLEVAAGESVSSTGRVFAGAKEWEELRHYQNDEGVPGFIDAIDWGWFFFLTKPIFAALHFLHGFIGNMGVAIILLTVGIKAILLPLAYKSYVSMARMKELQPEMEKLKEKAGDDRQKLQQGMMELYKKNKVNPAAGCLPILLQIPIFFSLYKVIFVTIELRHAAFFGPFQDLSSPDPTSLLNLFGLLPIAPPEPGTILALVFIGILPILLGISMWLQQKLNPAPTDATQAMIFAWLPWVFMFMLGGFASGLVVYWIANNTITFIQQYSIMRSHGSKPDLFGNIRSSFQKKRTEPGIGPDKGPVKADATNTANTPTPPKGKGKP